MTTRPHARPIPHASLVSYVVGFALSVTLTLSSFFVAPLFGGFAAAVIVVCALAQLFVQFFFFLHLGREEGPHWNLGLLMFAITIIGILVGGTLWIMNNLAHLHMSAATINDMYVNGIVAPQNELK